MATRKEIRNRPDYVNNKDFLEAMIEYDKAAKLALSRGEPRPVVSRYIAECFMKISRHLATKPNFSGYPFVEDMIGDGIENCLQYLHNFDPKKSQNPFAYFTQMVYYSFLRRIDKEKKNLASRFKYMDHMNTLGQTSSRQYHDTEVYDDSIKVSDGSKEYIKDFLEKFDDSKNKKKKA